MRKSTPTNDYNSVHEDLKQRQAFVVWKLETVPDRDTPTKVPYSPVTHTRARSTDSLTWASFDEALAAYEAGGYDGVGYVLSSGDPYTFIDLDKAINAGERARLLAEGSDDQFAGLKPWARFVRDIAPYAYIGLSQSGTGLHVIMRGKLPGTGRPGEPQLTGGDTRYIIGSRSGADAITIPVESETKDVSVANRPRTLPVLCRSLVVWGDLGIGDPLRDAHRTGVARRQRPGGVAALVTNRFPGRWRGGAVHCPLRRGGW
jgi:hypothetical protein